MQEIDTTQAFTEIRKKMELADCPRTSVAQFNRAYQRLVSGESGLLSESDIDPLDSAADFETISDYEAAGIAALPHTCLIKLNGGLGTSMGLDRAKSLLTAKDQLSFLDIIIKKTLYLRAQYECNLPLIFMNSFRTEEDTLSVLAKYPDFAIGQSDLPTSFLQNKVPKICQETLTAISWDADPSLEWCPPGHGDIYLALTNSGILDTLHAQGYCHLFISNSDNLGAVLDLNLLGYFATTKVPLLMEVADRTAADSKGGHVARSKVDGRLLLREAAQCPKEELSQFQNTNLYKYFNTNTLWIDVEALQAEMSKSEAGIELPIIKNLKTVDPTLPDSPKVFQLETAMGAALENFAEATVLRVARSRFAPVKKTEDLLGLRSDAYLMSDEFRVELAPQRQGQPPLLDLDPQFYGHITEFEKRFPTGVPSLIHCKRLEVRGDIVFNPDIVITDEVRIHNTTGQQQEIESGRQLRGDISL